MILGIIQSVTSLPVSLCKFILHMKGIDGIFLDILTWEDTDNEQFCPVGICVSDGKMFVTDQRNHRICVFDLKGTPIGQFGSWGPKNGQLKHPCKVVVYNKEIFVMDRTNDRICIFDLKGKFIRKFRNNDGKLFRPFGMCISNGKVYVTSNLTKNKRGCVVFDMSGNFLYQWCNMDSFFDSGDFYGIAVYNGEVFMADNMGNSIWVFDINGNFLRRWKYDEYHFVPREIVVHNGEVFVTEWGRGRVCVFDLNGKFLYQWGGVKFNNGKFFRPNDIIIYNGMMLITESSHPSIYIYQ